MRSKGRLVFAGFMFFYVLHPLFCLMCVLVPVGVALYMTGPYGVFSRLAEIFTARQYHMLVIGL